MPSNFTDLFQPSPPSFYPERQPINKLEENIALMRTAPTKCCVAVPLRLLLLSGEDEEGVGRQEVDARRCWWLLSVGGCCCGDASMHCGAEKMYIEKYIEITMSLCCKCGGTLRKKNL
jgi:hypothetical protein